jgi:acyl-CoA thioester hydrolase
MTDSRTRDGWPFSDLERVRFGDLDAMRHLNNVEFLRYFESARIAFLNWALPGGHDPSSPEAHDDFGVIFAECHINYRSPGRFGEHIRTWIRPLEIARSSVRLGFELTSDDDSDRLLAEGWGTLVGYDYAQERATAIPDTVRDRLVELGATPSYPPS